MSMNIFKANKGAGTVKRVWKPKTRIVGIDLGYTQGKCDAVELEDTIVIPSLAKLDTRREVNTLLESGDGYRVDLKKHGGGGTYLVGKRGQFDLNPNRFSGKSESTDYAKYFTLLALYLGEVNFRDIDLVVTGLPTEQTEGYSKHLEKMMTGTFNFSFEGRNFEVNAKRTWVLPQCMGAFYDYTLDGEGRIKQDAHNQARGRILAINIGGKTTEVGIIEDGKYTQDSYTTKVAVTNVQDALNKILINEHKVNTMTSADLDKILRSGEHPYTGVSLEKEINDALYAVFNDILDGMYRHEITTDFSMFNGVLLSGGGANLFASYFEDMVNSIGIPLLISEDPEGANAKGFRKFGLMVLRMRGKLEEEYVEVAVVE